MTKTILLVVTLWLMVLVAEPALACQVQTLIINGKMLVCTICPGITTCH